MRLRATLGILLTAFGLATQSRPAVAATTTATVPLTQAIAPSSLTIPTTVSAFASRTSIVREAPSEGRAQAGGVVLLANAGSHHGIGAGTIVSIVGHRVEIVTAKHVALYGALRVRLDDGTSVPAWIASLVADRDLAVVAADLPDATVAGLRVARIGNARSDEPVIVWGSGNDGPAFEPAATDDISADLPDGAPRGRYSLDCDLCHQGDSGAGIFAADGTLIGVYIGFFTVGEKRVSVAELPTGFAPQRAPQNSIALAAPIETDHDRQTPSSQIVRR